MFGFLNENTKCFVYIISDSPDILLEYLPSMSPLPIILSYTTYYIPDELELSCSLLYLIIELHCIPYYILIIH